MKHLNTGNASGTCSLQSTHALHNSESKKQHDYLCELEIIELQDKFLTNSFSIVPVANMAEGRTLVETIISSLQCYRSIAFLGTDGVNSAIDASDLYLQLIDLGLVHAPHKNNALEQFLLDSFYYDFMWIEATPELLQQEWFRVFEQAIVNLGLDTSLPVIVLSTGA